MDDLTKSAQGAWSQAHGAYRANILGDAGGGHPHTFIAAAIRAAVAAERHRIAARLRARADEEVKKAERASGTQYFSDAISHTHAAAVLRAEADALEVGT